MRDFRQLEVWKYAHQLTLEIYGMTTDFPECEYFSLMDQLRYCSAAVAANIAEGCGRTEDIELQGSLSLARGLASELDYYLLLARDLGLIQQSYRRLNAQTKQVEVMLTAFMRKIEEERTTRERGQIKAISNSLQ
jgi:four helix bundle protein